MIRRTYLALALVLALPIGLVACNGNEPVTGTPIGGGNQLTLADMTPRIVSSLTPTSAEQAFGFPNERTLTPPIVLTYYVENSGKVSLVFPDLTSTISFARYTDKAGVVTNLTILP